MVRVKTWRGARAVKDGGAIMTACGGFKATASKDICSDLNLSWKAADTSTATVMSMCVNGNVNGGGGV